MKERKGNAIVPYTCPECGKTMMLPKYGKRKSCPACSYERHKEACREMIRERRERQREAARDQKPKVAKPKPKKPAPEKPAPKKQDQPLATVADVLAYARKHGISSYGYAVTAMEKERSTAAGNYSRGA